MKELRERFARLVIIFIWAGLAVCVLAIPVLYYGVSFDTYGLFGEMPDFSELENPEEDLSSEIISSDGVILGKYFRKNRVSVEFREISSELINTVLVTEDIRFFSHSGIDFRGIARALYGKLTGNFKGGGSTLTMQLAENLYHTSTANRGSLYHHYPGIADIVTKFKEWIIAIRLERNYTKREIMSMYLNTIEFGSNSYGIKIASKTFFNKMPSELNYLESCVLIGSINAPTRYSPVLNPENAVNKRTEVLHNLYKYDRITRHEFDSMKLQPLGLQFRVDSHNEGLATYFRSMILWDLLGWSRENGYDLFEDGLRIHTTIDSRLQRYAEKALTDHMKKLQARFDRHWGDLNPWIDENGREIRGFLKSAIRRTDYYKYLVSLYGADVDSIEQMLKRKRRMKVFDWEGERDTLFSAYDSLAYYKRFLRAGFMAMEPQSGHIKAWVGGINHKYFKYDHVRQGKRQPGSTIKPIVYAAAIEAGGYSPCFPVLDAAITLQVEGQDPPTWTPSNSTGVFTNKVMTIRQAMARSVNSITAFMMHRIGAEEVVQYGGKLGIEGLEPVPALCLGAGGDVSIIEMVGAYSTFVNKGTYTKAFYIDRIEDKNGHLVQKFIPVTREALNEETAYIMLHMLKGTTQERGGTAMGLDLELRRKNDIGAKTGTTQNASDGWFVGVTKDLAAGVWVGGEDRSIHFRNWTSGQGARTAMPIWENFFLSVYADSTLPYKKGYFERPKRLTKTLNCDSYNDRNPREDAREFTEESIF